MSHSQSHQEHSLMPVGGQRFGGSSATSDFCTLSRHQSVVNDCAAPPFTLTDSVLVLFYMAFRECDLFSTFAKVFFALLKSVRPQTDSLIKFCLDLKRFAEP